MRRILLRAALFCATLASLAACEQVELLQKVVPGSGFELHPPATKAARKCADACPEAAQACERSCENDFTTCRHNLRLAAQRQYLAYVDERMAAGKLVKKTEQEFWNDATQQSCPAVAPCQERCVVSARVCHSKCGGKITKGDVCYANCAQSTVPLDDDDEPDADGLNSLWKDLL